MAKTLEEMYEQLIGTGVNEQALDLIIMINGYNAQVLQDVEYAVFGTREFACSKDEN